MKEGKSKPVKCEFKKESTYTPKGASAPVTSYSFWVEMEDGTKGFYNAKNKDKPKFIVGVEAEYTAEEQQGKEGKENFFIIKAKQEAFTNGSFKQKSPKEFALELSRKMYNSSQGTDDKWDINRMLTVATFLIKELDKGNSRAAIETATTIECANAVNKVKIDSKTMVANITIINNWLK